MYKCFAIVLLFAVLVNAMPQEPQFGDGVVSAYKKQLIFAIACIAFPDYAAAQDTKQVKPDGVQGMDY